MRSPCPGGSFRRKKCDLYPVRPARAGAAGSDRDSGAGIQPDRGFEAFTVAIHEKSPEGREAFYIFDCLSELQSVWYTDLMMGNFFRVTCPYLFELDTVAYFPLLRGRHSFDAVARIRDTTQLLLDVFSNGDYVYFHPLKVWNRYSEHMFMPHCYRKSTRDFITLEDGVGMSPGIIRPCRRFR